MLCVRACVRAYSPESGTSDRHATSETFELVQPEERRRRLYEPKRKKLRLIGEESSAHPTNFGTRCIISLTSAHGEHLVHPGAHGELCIALGCFRPCFLQRRAEGERGNLVSDPSRGWKNPSAALGQLFLTEAGEE